MTYDVVIIGAGAAGLMCAAQAAKRGLCVRVIDHANKPGKKILMSGGGRCNFTNYYVEPARFLSSNAHFCKSALARYTQWDFVALMDSYSLAYHEKTLGQLFCDHKAKDLLAILLAECERYDVVISMATSVEKITYHDGFYHFKTTQGRLTASRCVIATGGLSIPTMGASGFGYDIAQQFGLNVLPTRAGLVPFTLTGSEKERSERLSGVAVDALVSFASRSFREAILFTHRGLSGPAILQISSYWQLGQSVKIDLLPDTDLKQILMDKKQMQGKLQLKTVLESLLPRRLLPEFIAPTILATTLADLSQASIDSVVVTLKSWLLKPSGTEGYRTAEVTLGGVDPNELSSKTFESVKQPGLYFIGEVIDVTGWLGGYNFQWAWSSAVACALAL